MADTNFLKDILVFNISGGSACDEGKEQKQVYSAVMIAIVVIGLIGNVLVFSTILILREYKKSVTNWYILQLALADTLFLLMLPLTAHSEIVGTWEFSLSLCKFKEAVIFINYYASIYFLVIMSFDRYLAVTKAFASKKWVTSLRSPTASYLWSLGGWVLSILCSIPLFRYSSIVKPCQTCAYVFPKDEDDAPVVLEEAFTLPENPACKITPSYEFSAWIYGNFIAAFCFPFLLICFFYGMIIKTITRASTAVGNAERQRSYRRRVTMIVFALVALFLVSWLPWYVEKLAKLQGINLSKQACKNLQYAVRSLAYLNSALNPYFYSFLGTHFRSRLKRARTQMGFLAIRSRNRGSMAGSVQKKKRKYSTSNSDGSSRSSNKKGSGKHHQEEVFSDVKTIGMKTEKTVAD